MYIKVHLCLSVLHLRPSSGEKEKQNNLFSQKTTTTITTQKHFQWEDRGLKKKSFTARQRQTESFPK